MTAEKVSNAKKLAREFIDACVDLENERDGTSYCWYRSKKSATVRRRSMDLTRALADLRRPE